MTDPVDREKVNELMARMLTCATFLNTIEISEILIDQQMEAIIDARSLLVQAASALEQLKPPPVPMEILEPIPPPPANFTIDRTPSPYWTDPGPPPKPPERRQNTRACPNCGSRAQKSVHRKPGKSAELECPMCGYRWPYAATAKWI